MSNLSSFYVKVWQESTFYKKKKISEKHLNYQDFK